MAEIEVVGFVVAAFFLGYYLGWYSRGRYSLLPSTRRLAGKAIKDVKKKEKK